MKYYYETFYTCSDAIAIDAFNDVDAVAQVKESYGEELKNVLLIYVLDPEYRTVWQEPSSK